MATAMNLPPNYIRLDPLNEIETQTELICKEEFFKELFIQKIASNEFITPSIIQSPHIYYDENMKSVIQFKIKKLTIIQSLADVPCSANYKPRLIIGKMIASA
jgi:hypothetical protein